MITWPSPSPSIQNSAQHCTVGFSDRILVVTVDSAHVAATPSVVRNIDVSKETEMVALRPIIGSVDLAVAPSVVRKIAKKRGYGFWKILFILLALTSILVLLFLLTPFLRRDLHNSCSSYNSLNRVNYDWIEKNWINGPPPTWSIFVYLYTCIPHLFCLIKQILLCYDTLHGFRLDYDSSFRSY